MFQAQRRLVGLSMPKLVVCLQMNDSSAIFRFERPSTLSPSKRRAQVDARLRLNEIVALSGVTVRSR
jgi:hypothetical protein